jgi:hypothetical protein
MTRRCLASFFGVASIARVDARGRPRLIAADRG